MTKLRPKTLSWAFLLHVLIVFALALVVRLAYWQDARAYAIGADEPDYVLPAQTLLRDGRYVDTFITPGRTWTRVPLTSLVFAGSFLFVPDEAAKHAAGDDAALMEPRYDALNLVQIIESLLTVGLIMLLAGRIFPQRKHYATVVSGYIAALYPPLASSPAQRALSEPTSILFVVAAIYAFSWWSPEAAMSKNLLVAIIGGALVGFGSLARPIALTFLPFILVWLFVTHRFARKSSTGHVEENEATGDEPRRVGFLGRYRKPLLVSLVATVVAFFCIAPWTLYNYRQYDRFLLLDTASTTAYWNYHNFRGEDITARMVALPNPADRLSLIISEGTANIFEYPGQAAGSVVFAFFYFWHLESNSAVLLNPWDMTQREPDVPDLLHADAAFLLVGLMGVCGLAGVGFRRVHDEAGRTLLLSNLWLLSMLLLGLVVPYDGRYRLPAVPSFIVLAAGLLILTDWRAVFSPSRAWRIVRGHVRVVVAAFVLCLWVMVGAYSPSIPPLLRTLYQSWRGDLALQSGDAGSAIGRYRLAQQAFPSFFYGYRREADAARIAGMDDAARQVYARTRELAPDDAYSILGFADLAARHPEWAFTARERDWLLRDESDWRGNPWNSFHPSPTRAIDVGRGGDSVYIRGFYRPDQPSPDFNYRWSRGRAMLRIPLPPGTFKAVSLRMSAPGIGPNEPKQVNAVTNDALINQLQEAPGWADYSEPIPARATQGGTLTLQITSPTRRVADYVPDTNDPRSLGVGIDSVTLVEGP
ncbi:MAG: hypothetical protein QOH93_1856 [Chloroflexia bacterium]|nr:hypothetical protein [Chloroflexia bacterium]